MKGQFRDIKTAISYTQHGDYYLPDLQLPQQKDLQLNRFRRARLGYLKSMRTEHIVAFYYHVDLMNI